MKAVRHSYILFILLFCCIARVEAAEIIVQPGNDTLQSAANNSQPGDILVLKTGSYTDTSALAIPHSLTIKAESASAQPVLLMPIGQANDAQVELLRIQGVTMFSDARRDFFEFDIESGSQNDDFVTNLEILESVISAQIHFKGERITLVGSEVDCYGLTIEAQVSQFFGNDLCHLYIRTNGSPNDSAHIIGNIIRVKKDGSARGFNAVFTNTVYFTANRVIAEFNFDVPSSTPTGHSLISTSNRAGLIFIRNNIFTFKRRSSQVIEGLRLVGELSDIEAFYLENNIFDFTNVQVDGGERVPADQRLIAAHQGAGKSFHGNIFVNSPIPIISSALRADINNNLCFNNLSNCWTKNGNLDVDPLFVDAENGDYRLQAQSPAIDKGTEDPTFYDTDRTRNDIGAYSGSWSIDQFDAQREASATGPYVYPIQDIAKNVVNGSVKIEFVSYPRLK